MLEPEVGFQADGSFSPGPMAKFLDMPQSPLFTLNLNTPESWMVESVHTRYDLDNIYLQEVQQYVRLGSVRISGGKILKSVSQSVFLFTHRFEAQPTLSCSLNEAFTFVPCFFIS